MTSHFEELQKMSEKFLGLWQEQLSSAMKDPELIAMTLKMMQSMQDFYGNAGSNATTQGKQPTTSAPAPIYGDGNALINELTQRIETCEKRLAAIESSRKEESYRKPKPRKSFEGGFKPERRSFDHKKPYRKKDS